MARAPVAGRCKTRLAPVLGARGAARLYAAMLADRIDAIDATPAARRALVAAPEDDGVEILTRLAPAGWEVIEQSGADLGARLASAFEALRETGWTCLVDSDSPTLALPEIWPALSSSIATADVVLGPCEDGGYYLVGMRVPEPRIFEGIPWSTGDVLAATRRRCEQLGLRVHELETAWDVDEPRDVERLSDVLSLAWERAPQTAAVLREIRAGGSE